MKETEETAKMMEELRKALSSCSSNAEFLRVTAEHLQHALLSNFVVVEIFSDDSENPPQRAITGSPRAEGIVFTHALTLHGDELWYRDEVLPTPFYASRLSEVKDSDKGSSYAYALEEEGLYSLAVLALFRSGHLIGAVQVGFLGKHHHWRVEDRFFLQQTAQQLEQALFPIERKKSLPAPSSSGSSSSKKVQPPTSLPPGMEFEKLLGYGQLVLIRTDDKFVINEIFGSAEKLFGIPRSQMLGRSDIWEKVMDPHDLRRLNLRLRRMADRPHEFGEEIRFTRVDTQETRWLLLKATPVFDEDGTFVGWEGFGVDITERRMVEIQLRAQRERTEALYEVSRALRVNLDPALVTLKGLNALIRATGSDAGFCCFYDSALNSVEMVAAEGLSQNYLDGIGSVVDGKSLVRYAIETKKGLLLANIQEDERAAQDMARLEDLKATIVMPLLSGRRVLGAIVIFSRQAERYRREDFQLVAAAASQISFAARQAEFYAAEKQEADTLGVLYRLTHEISKLFSPREIGEHIFSIIQQEFASKRLWFGVLNNEGTHIVGHAGYGPGVRQQLREIEIELGIRHDFLDQAIRTKRPVIVPAGTEMECSGLNRLIRRLDLSAFIIIPLMSLGKVVGILVAEPVISSEEYIHKKLSILTRMMTEVGTVLMARRFEERVAESDKMRVATVLASGVAHNFNNLLQAVMGQASLIQMQAEEDSPVQKLARTIIDSAGKGASLVKHLLSFSSPTDSLRERFSVGKMLLDSRDLYSSLLGAEIEFDLQVPEYPLEMLGDLNLLQQAFTNILMNAKEAIGDEMSGGKVEVKATRVRLRSGEIDPMLSPGTYLRIDIQDNGNGMDEERLQRCFEPFYSSKNQDAITGLSLSGAGLGLSSAYSIIRQHSGIVTARSKSGVGTTMSCFLPQFEQKVAEVKELLTVPNQEMHSALLVQGQGSTGINLRRIFEQFGMRARSVSDTDMARVILESPQQQIQLLLLDADYLGKATLNFIDEVREKFSKIRIVVTTVSRLEWQSQLEEHDIVKVVEKPLSMRVLQGMIRKFTEERSTASKLSTHVERSATAQKEKAEELEELPTESDGVSSSPLKESV